MGAHVGGDSAEQEFGVAKETILGHFNTAGCYVLIGPVPYC
jgi:hypothetical protein